MSFSKALCHASKRLSRAGDERRFSGGHLEREERWSVGKWRVKPVGLQEHHPALITRR